MINHTMTYFGRNLKGLFFDSQYRKETISRTNSSGNSESKNASPRESFRDVSKDKHANEIEPAQTESESNQSESVHGLQRRLLKRQIQLIGFGGAIGTNVFGSLGVVLYSSGPLSLLLGIEL